MMRERKIPTAIAVRTDSKTISFGGIRLSSTLYAVTNACAPSTMLKRRMRIGAFPPTQRLRASLRKTTHHVGPAWRIDAVRADSGEDARGAGTSVMRFPRP
jgi:hypothetical protein